jgi:hypothetical protein
MTSTPRLALNPLVLIGVILSVLAGILSLILMVQLAWVLPVLSPPFITDGGDNTTLYFNTVYLFPLDHDLYWLFILIAVGLGLLTSLSGRGYALTFMILMITLTNGALLVRGVYVWLFVIWPGTHRDLLLFAKNILFYDGQFYIVALPVFGLVLAVIMFLFQNKNTKMA